MVEQALQPRPRLPLGFPQALEVVLQMLLLHHHLTVRLVKKVRSIKIHLSSASVVDVHHEVMLVSE